MELTDGHVRRLPAVGGELVVRADGQIVADVSEWTDADHLLTERTREKLRAAVPAETFRAYQRWWRLAATWCATAGRVPLPMTPQTLTEFVRVLTDTISDRTKRPYSVASLEQAVAAVRAVHTQAGWDGMPGTTEARTLIRDHGARLADDGRAEKQSAIVTADQALEIAESCDPAALAGARDRVLISFSFAAWTRRSELAALTLVDVRVSTDPAKPGVYVRFRKSKTDQAGKGAEAFLPARGGDALCPLQAYRTWRTLLAERGITSGRLLRGVYLARTPARQITDSIAPRTVNDISKRLVGAAGYAVDEQGREFTAHGWRASGRSAARAAGASKESADRHGRWSEKTNTGDRYERDRGELADHPMAKVAARQAQDAAKRTAAEAPTAPADTPVEGTDLVQVHAPDQNPGQLVMPV
ncbi:hypothetical protein ACFZDG_35460 [Kitasatospora xanthocidica]|uniref:hypothetical protein n=1 Tax=Kitasatospora xanthocidica TaxID=83382 RepID=UPI0036E1C048